MIGVLLLVVPVMWFRRSGVPILAQEQRKQVHIAQHNFRVNRSSNHLWGKGELRSSTA